MSVAFLFFPLAKKIKKLFQMVQKVSRLTFRIQPSRAKEVRQMSANERRMQILEVLCERKFETIDNLMFEFSASRATIKRDIQELILSYPVYTVQGHGGGVRIYDGYRLGMKYLSEKQSNLLEKLAVGLTGEDLATMQSILKKVKEPKRGNK